MLFHIPSVCIGFKFGIPLSTLDTSAWAFVDLISNTGHVLGGGWKGGRWWLLWVSVDPFRFCNSKALITHTDTPIR